VLALVALILSAWVWRGYEPRVWINGQMIKPLAFSPTDSVLAVASAAGGGSIKNAPVGALRFLSSLDGKLFAVLQARDCKELELVIFDLATRTRIGAQTVPYRSYAGSGPNGTVAYRFASDSSFAVSNREMVRNGCFFRVPLEHSQGLSSEGCRCMRGAHLMNPAPIARQGQFPACIHQSSVVKGCAPAEADMERFFQITAPSVHSMVLTLERRGFIRRVPGRARSIILSSAPESLPPLKRIER
jgi:hypothetical protein